MSRLLTANQVIIARRYHSCSSLSVEFSVTQVKDILSHFFSSYLKHFAVLSNFLAVVKMNLRWRRKTKNIQQTEWIAFVLLPNLLSNLLTCLPSFNGYVHYFFKCGKYSNHNIDSQRNLPVWVVNFRRRHLSIYNCKSRGILNLKLPHFPAPLLQYNYAIDRKFLTTISSRDISANAIMDRTHNKLRFKPRKHIFNNKITKRLILKLCKFYAYVPDKCMLELCQPPIGR